MCVISLQLHVIFLVTKLRYVSGRRFITNHIQRFPANIFHRFLSNHINKFLSIEFRGKFSINIDRLISINDDRFYPIQVFRFALSIFTDLDVACFASFRIQISIFNMFHRLAYNHTRGWWTIENFCDAFWKCWHFVFKSLINRIPESRRTAPSLSVKVLYLKLDERGSKA